MPVAIILLIFSNFRLDAFWEICSSYKRRIYHAHCKIASELRLNSKILLKKLFKRWSPRSEQARLGYWRSNPSSKKKAPKNYRQLLYNNGKQHNIYISEITEEMHRKIYYEAVHNVVQTITARFNQPDWAVYRNTQQSLKNALNGQRYEDKRCSWSIRGWYQ